MFRDTLENSKRKATHYLGSSIRTAIFSEETTEGRRQWDNIFRMLKEKDYQQRILYLTKLPLKNEELRHSRITTERTHHLQIYPVRDTKRSLLSWNGRREYSCLSSHKDIKNITKCKYIGKIKDSFKAVKKYKLPVTK